MNVHWRTLRCAAWLGWQIETNWANPWLFLLYVLIKPLAGSMLLVCMYWAACSARGGVAAPGFLSFLYVSSACFMLIGGVTYGMSSAVVTDRESFGMLKFIRISPGHFPSYLLGRGLAKAAQAAIGASTTLLVGLLLFAELRVALLGRNTAWTWLLVYGVLGAVMVVSIGLILAGAALNMARYGMFLSEGITGCLYLLSGAVFPIDVLPPWLRPLSLALPPTYWLEGMRRALLGPSELSTPLAAFDHDHLCLSLAASSAVLAVIAFFFFRWCALRAWRLGRFDETSSM
jgi:ABC-2 type transport system permease protein